MTVGQHLDLRLVYGASFNGSDSLKEPPTSSNPAAVRLRGHTATAATYDAINIGTVQLIAVSDSMCHRALLAGKQVKSCPIVDVKVIKD